MVTISRNIDNMDGTGHGKVTYELYGLNIKGLILTAETTSLFHCHDQSSFGPSSRWEGLES
jgi:hypothetical protein